MKKILLITIGLAVMSFGATKTTEQKESSYGVTNS